MKPIRVAHITTVDLSLRYLLLNQLRSLQAAGYEVTGISALGPDVAAIELAGVRHIAVDMTRSFTPWADLVALTQLIQVMRREQFDIVHTHTPKAGLLGQLAARIAGVPIVVNTLHGFYFHDHMPRLSRWFYMAMEWLAARCSDIILSQNAEDMRTAVRHHICPPERLRYLGNGIDVRRFDRASLDEAELARLRDEFGIEEGAPVVGFVGRLVAEKGIRELFEAARIIRQAEPRARLLIVGPIDEAKADAITPAAAREYGIEEMCVFAGLRQDMPEMYALMDVFVLPSHREGFPRAPMEASAMGVPVVVTDIRGCREAVEHDANGLLVPLGDVAALAEAVITLLQDRERARRLGETGRCMTRQRFDEQKVFETVKAEYARLLAEKGYSVASPSLRAPAIH